MDKHTNQTKKQNKKHIYKKEKRTWKSVCVFKLEEALKSVSYDYQYNMKAVRKFQMLSRW